MRAARVIAAWAVGAAALGQEAPPDAMRDMAVESLPPAVRLGVRAESLLRRMPVASAVVIVPDAGAYAEAIARWSPRLRYPVLIDDGSAQAGEDIARFVRAFAPARVVRWDGPDDRRGRSRERRAAVERAAAAAWGAAADAEDWGAAMRARWAELGVEPAGIIIADERDAAWTAALALCAGRGEPLAWVESPAGLNRAMTQPDAAGLMSAVERACAEWGYPWTGLGDQIDAVTLCAGAPVKVEAGEKEWVATTDLLGRRGVQGRERWAWAGQIAGDPARAAYAAMCALFLRTESAWLFEGYPDTEPWSRYSAARAASALREAGLDAAALGSGALGEAAWRGAASRPVDAGLICVNSKGNRDFFELGDARCQPGDIPFLARPAIVYFVHSWSANAPANRTTVAGRWLERGAYAYFGSVQEPQLGAFVPTPNLASRLASGAAWGAAVRLEGGPAWKLATIGDPLITLGSAMGPWPERSDEPPPLEGAEDLAELLKPLLKEKKYAEALRMLVLLGRDDEAARLVLAVAKDEPDLFDPAVAAEGIMPLFRTGRKEGLLRAFAQLDARGRADPVFRDALWNAFGPDLATTSDLAVVDLLGEHLRSDQVARDALALVGAVERARGPGAGRAFLDSARARTIDPREQAEFDRAAGERPGRRGGQGPRPRGQRDR